ncbi:stage III sporulation protein AH [Peribacillus simplex]|uniref:stage III sporulation protein AH n=1 Tax=Peribacillus simplex TaxID=1478 RepID=UPI003820377F
MLSIERNPKNRVYLELLVLCFDVCDEFHLVVRNNMGSIRGLEEIINKLKVSLIEMRCESTWASTTLGDNQTANVYYFHADENAKKITKSIYQGGMPSLPEDLSFLNKERFGWLLLRMKNNDYLS